tara:strand:- start:99 stop:527 length:429 start_codon:yes stop_codon:yes gene_type:complete
MSQKILSEIYRNNFPTRKKNSLQKRLTDDEKRFILWCILEKWSSNRISETLKISIITVQRFKSQYKKTPSILLNFNLIQMTSRITRNEYFCLLCGNYILKEDIAENHLIEHFVKEKENFIHEKDLENNSKSVASKSNWIQEL